MDRINRKYSHKNMKDDTLYTNSNNRLLDRRSCLKALGAAATAAGAIGAATGTAAADGDEYDVIEVSPGQTWTHRLSDGEVFENYLIDISAKGAEAELYAQSNDWVIRNVGFRGTWDTYRRGQFIFASVPSQGATGRIENVYMGDGAVGNSYPDGPNGIYVSASHAGTLEIDTVNIQGMPDNAIYGSEPGRTAEYHGTSGAMGDLVITNSYARNCRAGGFRIGTSGSRLENCVAVGCDRNIWVRFRDPSAVNCESSAGRIGDISVGGMGWDSYASTHATLSVENCRYETTNFQTGTNEIIGSSVGPAQRTQPDEVDGVPVTAVEAASGSSAGTSPQNPADEPDDTDDEPEDANPEDSLLAFVTEPDARLAGYEFTAEGAVEFTTAPYETPSGRSIEGGTYKAKDFIEDDGENVTAGGVTGGGYGDAFLVDGPITSIDIDQPDVMWVELDGEELPPAEIIAATAPDEDDETDEGEDTDDTVEGPADVIVIDGTASADSVSYSFSVSGSLEPSTYGEASINDEAEVGENEVDGVIFDDRDAYWFSGEFTSFWLAGNASVTIERDVR